MAQIVEKAKNTLMPWLKKHMESGTLFVFALGMCIMNGKQVVAWNIAVFWFGFYVVLITTMIAGAMSIMMTYNFAEMVSIVPFSGGCYGYVRCTLGPTAGYVAGFIELCKYVLYTSMMVSLVGGCFSATYDLEDKWMPVVWLAFFVMSVSLQLVSSRVIWWTWGILALTAFAFQLIFILGALRAGDEQNLKPEVNRFHEVFMAEFYGTRYFAPYTYPTLFECFMRAFPFANFLFCGIDAVRTCANDQSNKTVPYAMVFVDYWTYIIVILTIVAGRAYVSYTYELVLPPYPYDAGTVLAHPGLNPKLITLFSLPGSIGTALGFNYAAGRQMRSMACSGLLPEFLSTTQKDSTDEEMTTVDGKPACKVRETKPVMAILVCSIISFSVLCWAYFEVYNYIFKIIRMADLMTCIEAIGVSAAFIVFATRFDGMDRAYKSPVGIPGAILVILYFLFQFITMLQYDYDGDHQGLCLTLFGYCVVMMTYYFLVANKRQFYSKEEQEKFMKAYIVNANKRRRMHGVKKPGEPESKKSSSKKFFSSIGKVYSNLTAPFSAPSSMQPMLTGLSNNKVCDLERIANMAALVPGDEPCDDVPTAPKLNGKVNPCADLPGSDKSADMTVEVRAPDMTVEVRAPETANV